jgi:hypothetical protein
MTPYPALESAHPFDPSFGLNVTFKPSSGINVTFMPNGDGDGDGDQGGAR